MELSPEMKKARPAVTGTSLPQVEYPVGVGLAYIPSGLDPDRSSIELARPGTPRRR